MEAMKQAVIEFSVMMKKLCVIALGLLPISIACVSLIYVASTYAQADPMGRFFDAPLDLIDPNSEEQVHTASHARVFDINGDGRDDIAFVVVISELDLETDRAIQIWTSNQAGTMENSTDVLIEGGIPSTSGDYRQSIPADYNGDGRLDLFFVTH